MIHNATVIMYNTNDSCNSNRSNNTSNNNNNNAYI